jgi:hypothetical protein
VGGRNAEQPADPVAHVGLDAAAELLDGARHPCHELADERLDLVRAETLPEPGRADDVGEQRRDGAHLVLGSGVDRHAAEPSGRPLGARARRDARHVGAVRVVTPPRRSDP